MQELGWAPSPPLFQMQRTNLHPAKFEINTVLEWEDWKHVVLPRIAAAAKLPIRRLKAFPAHTGHAVIVGAGPSAVNFVEKIKGFSNQPLTTFFSVNGAHQWLIERELKPKIHVLFEHDVDTCRTSLGGLPDPEVVYYVASHCSPDVFRELHGYRYILWHAFIPLQEYQDAINTHFPGEFMVAGGYATFFRTLTIAYLLGYRDFDLFGVDSSFESNSHLDGYPTSNVEESISVWGVDPRDDTIRKFTSQGGLAFQASEFIKFCEQYHKDIKLRVHGDSLLRYLHETRYPEQYQSLEG